MSTVASYGVIFLTYRTVLRIKKFISIGTKYDITTFNLLDVTNLNDINTMYIILICFRFEFKKDYNDN